MKFLLFIIVSLPMTVLAAVPLADGKYRLIAEIQICKHGSNELCAITDRGSNAEFTFKLTASPWDLALSTKPKVPLILIGELKKKSVFTMELPPVLYQENKESLFNQPPAILPLGPGQNQ